MKLNSKINDKVRVYLQKKTFKAQNVINSIKALSLMNQQIQNNK
jgi:hypothetical protein